ncbi:unnamed protein product [Somion occarium]|uniref:Uncharacterized protein n=1 Tax=Somion occarium TaxID=3059160 RepID=A0ABP1DDM2_9APHY
MTPGAVLLGPAGATDGVLVCAARGITGADFFVGARAFCVGVAVGFRKVPVVDTTRFVVGGVGSLFVEEPGLDFVTMLVPVLVVLEGTRDDGADPGRVDDATDGGRVDVDEAGRVESFDIGLEAGTREPAARVVGGLGIAVVVVERMRGFAIDLDTVGLIVTDSNGFPSAST